MPVFKLTGFTGEQPRILPRLLPDTAAQDAFNVRLDDGGLTPIRVSVQQASLPKGKIQSIYRHNGEWLTWPAHISACPGPVASDRLYYTGDGAPKMRINDKVFDLAMPRPAAVLQPSITKDSKPESGNDKKRDIFTRFYTYTYVSEFGEESEPAPVGNSVDWKDGQTIRLTGFQKTAVERGIKYQRIYRTQTAASGTYLYFIAERPVSTSDFDDAIPVDKFNEPLPSASWNAPPPGLAGLTAMPNGMMAAFSGRKLYFCEPWRPHAWPEKYMLSTDTDIVALGAIGTALIVLTTGQPYLCSGTTPDTMQMVKLESNFPCINARSVVDLGFCIIYASYEGLVAVGAGGDVRLVSANLFNRDAWLALSPQTMVAGQISGRYVAFYRTVFEEMPLSGALLIDAGATPFLIRLSENAVAVFYEVETGALHYIRPDGNDIYRLDSPQGDRHKFYWRSRQFYLPYPENFGVILVESDRTLSSDEQRINETKIQEIKNRNAAVLSKGSVGGEMNAGGINVTPLGGDMLIPEPQLNGTVNVGVIADGKRIAQINRTNAPQRLPGGFSARKWEVEVSADITISTITLAKTIDELKGAA